MPSVETSPRINPLHVQTGEQRLLKLATEIAEGGGHQVTVRELLSWFGAKRRGMWIVLKVRAALKRAKLMVEPDFEAAYIDSLVTLLHVHEAREPDSTRDPDDGLESTTDVVDAPGSPTPIREIDPAHRVSKLAAANNPPLSVKPDEPLSCAITMMLTNDYSQLPVMTTDREVKGVVSWRSVGTRLAMGHKAGRISEFMDPHVEVSSSASIFAIIPFVSESNYVLVRAPDKRVAGIVTAHDLNDQFQLLAGPFLLLGEIENNLRRIIDGRFTLPELAAVRDQVDSEREVTGVADLTFGEYVKLLENPERWSKIGLQSLDRAAFVTKLDAVRRIRNEVMHFDPDGVPDEDLRVLRDFSKFLQRLHEVVPSRGTPTA